MGRSPIEDFDSVKLEEVKRFFSTVRRSDIEAFLIKEGIWLKAGTVEEIASGMGMRGQLRDAQEKARQNAARVLEGQSKFSQLEAEMAALRKNLQEKEQALIENGNWKLYVEKYGDLRQILMGLKKGLKEKHQKVEKKKAAMQKHLLDCIRRQQPEVQIMETLVQKEREETAPPVTDAVIEELRKRAKKLEEKEKDLEDMIYKVGKVELPQEVLSSADKQAFEQHQKILAEKPCLEALAALVEAAKESYNQAQELLR